MMTHTSTADQAEAKVDKLYEKRSSHGVLEYYQHANCKNPSERLAIKIILTELITSRFDLENAMEKVSALPYSGDVLFKAYKAVIAQYYHY
jgi:hypothetical protein